MTTPNSDRIPFPLELKPVGQGHEKVAEPSDPYVATAVALPTFGYDGITAMARTFVEEFALMGWSRQRILRMFTVPRYVAAHAVYRARGPEFVAALVDEVFGQTTAADTLEV